MEPRSQPAVAGPVIFFGLIIYTMFAPSIDLTDYANPADTMDVNAISTPHPAVRVAANIRDYAPARRPPLAPARYDAGLIPKQAGFDGTALATTPSQSPLRYFTLATAFDMSSPIPPAITGHAVPALPLHDGHDRLSLRPLPEAPDIHAPASPGIHHWVSVTGLAVNLRAGPDRNAEVIGQFDTGQLALKTEESGIWSRITLLSLNPPQSGWMATRYLEMTVIAPPARENPHP